jgi:hypothetical protein
MHVLHHGEYGVWSELTWELLDTGPFVSNWLGERFHVGYFAFMTGETSGSDPLTSKGIW